MTTASLSDEALLVFFHSHPNLRDRVISILGAVENSNGDLGEADAAEERLVEEMRLFGRVRFPEVSVRVLHRAQDRDHSVA